MYYNSVQLRLKARIQHLESRGYSEGIVFQYEKQIDMLDDIFFSSHRFRSGRRQYLKRTRQHPAQLKRSSQIFNHSLALRTFDVTSSLIERNELSKLYGTLKDVGLQLQFFALKFTSSVFIGQLASFLMNYSLVKIVMVTDLST